jgi:hypothetical protein
LRLRFSDALGLEGSINYRTEQYAAGYVKATSWPVMVTGLFYPIPFFYGAIGAGWYNTSIQYNVPSGVMGGSFSNSSETSQRIGWHFGGGLEVPVGPTAKFVCDVKYVFLDYKFKSVPGTGGVNSDFYVISASLQFGL